MQRYLLPGDALTMTDPALALLTALMFRLAGGQRSEQAGA
jgi:hypothetical protein